jgi:hypothetical protein
MLSSGSDGSLRLWDMDKLMARVRFGCAAQWRCARVKALFAPCALALQTTHFAGASMHEVRGSSLASFSVGNGSTKEAIVFHPNADGAVIGFHSATGKEYCRLAGHFHGASPRHLRR